MILKPNEICKFSKNCEYHNSKIGLANNFCQGTNPLRIIYLNVVMLMVMEKLLKKDKLEIFWMLQEKWNSSQRII